MRHLPVFFLSLLLLLPLMPATDAALAQQTSTVQGAYQRYEGGHMLWLGDTGEIWVLMDTGAVWHFTEDVVRGLPPNPEDDPAPAGFIMPTSGFGRIWGHHSNIRAQLGFALHGEQGYTQSITRHRQEESASRIILSVNLPNARRVEIKDSGQWRYAETNDTSPYVLPTLISELPAVTEMPAAFQRFENGYMMFWEDTGSIWVLLDNGLAYHYHSWTYGALAPNPVEDEAPAGKIKPVLGFGKVWGHYDGVRTRLGWATGELAGYMMDFERSESFGQTSYFVTLPDGSRLRIYADGRWTTA